MGAVTSPCLGAPVDDFTVRGVGTGQMPQALTPSTPCKAGSLLLGKRGKLLRFLLWSSVRDLGRGNFLYWDFGDFWGLSLYQINIQQGLTGHWGCCVPWGRADPLGIC